MDNAQLLAELIASQTPAHLIVAVSQLTIRIAELETQLAFRAQQSAADDARRARDAERQQRRRDNLRMSRDVTGQSRDANRHILKKEEREESKKEKKVYIPANFELNEADRAVCQELNWPSSKIATELTRFRDHAAQNARRCADWHAAWRSWVRSPYQTNGKNHPAETQGYKPSVFNFDEPKRPALP